MGVCAALWGSCPWFLYCQRRIKYRGSGDAEILYGGEKEYTSRYRAPAKTETNKQFMNAFLLSVFPNSFILLKMLQNVVFAVNFYVLGHRVGSRVLSFFSNRGNWDSPNPSPPPPPVWGVGAHPPAREGLGESQFRRGDIHLWYSL